MFRLVTQTVVSLFCFTQMPLYTLIIAAISQNHVLGKDGGLVWNLPDDRAFMEDHICDQYLIMGRRSYEELVNDNFFPGKKHLIITRNTDYVAEYGEIVASYEEAIRYLEALGVRKAYVLGGGQIFQQVINQVDTLLITEIYGEFEGDAFFPEIDEAIWQEVSRHAHPADQDHAYAFDFVRYEKRA